MECSQQPRPPDRCWCWCWCWCRCQQPDAGVRGHDAQPLWSALRLHHIDGVLRLRRPRMLNTGGSVNKIHGSSNTIHVSRVLKCVIACILKRNRFKKRDAPCIQHPRRRQTDPRELHQAALRGSHHHRMLQQHNAVHWVHAGQLHRWRHARVVLAPTEAAAATVPGPPEGPSKPFPPPSDSSQFLSTCSSLPLVLERSNVAC